MKNCVFYNDSHFYELSLKLIFFCYSHYPQGETRKHEILCKQQFQVTTTVVIINFLPVVSV